MHPAVKSFHIPCSLMSLYGCNNHKYARHISLNLQVQLGWHVRRRKIPEVCILYSGFYPGMRSVIHPAASFRRNPTLSWSSAKTGLHPDVGAGLADALPLLSSHFPSPITPSAAEMCRMRFLEVFNWVSGRVKVDIFKMMVGYQITTRHCTAITAAL